MAILHGKNRIRIIQLMLWYPILRQHTYYLVFIYCSKLLFNFTAGYLQVYDVFCPILLNYIELLDVILRKKCTTRNSDLS